MEIPTTGKPVAIAWQTRKKCAKMFAAPGIHARYMHNQGLVDLLRKRWLQSIFRLQHDDRISSDNDYANVGGMSAWNENH